MRNASPASSPRLPSPPPFPEVQLPPNSPGMHAVSASENVDTSKVDSQGLRRIRPGTKAADMASGPPLVPLSELDSPFQLQEHLKSLHAHHTRSTTDPDSTTPITHNTALQIATTPQNIDRSLWLYELTRFLVMRANDLIVSFFRESPPCSATTCPEMRASEWQYLCAVHEPPKPCCAIDYSCHTLDWAAYILTSQKQFPSRLTLGSEASGGTQQGVRQLTNIMRRVYRIFAHAWFQHRGVFWDVEGREGLYMLFKTVCDVYGLIPEENYTIPREAEGLDEVTEEQRERPLSPTKRPPTGEPKADVGNDEQTPAPAGPGATQRRHKATPSVGSAVTTIQEGDEEDKGADSPTKQVLNEEAGQMGKTQARASHRDVPEAPLAAISKTAESKDAPPSEIREEVPMIKIEDEPSRGSEPEGKTEEHSEPENRQESHNGLRRSSSCDSVATMVKVEEKEPDDE
ncbi:MAG: hypothetical protein Q9164_005004 [Protoblastenia rupestris]